MKTIRESDLHQSNSHRSYFPCFSRLVAILLAVALVSSGCSLFRSGKKSEEGGELSEADLNAQREGRFGSGAIPLAEGEGVFRDITFDYDSYSINDAARQNIEYNAEILRSNPDIRIQLEGHCDERGTVEYNLALGEKRAKSVEDVLVSLGIASGKVASISYGEEVPLDPEHDESAWARNRRVHLSGFRDVPKS